MLGKLYNLVAPLAVATVLTVGSFAGYLFASGRLTAARLERLAQVLRGELDAPPPGPAPTSAPADPAPAASPRVRAAEEVRAARRRDHLESLRLERAKADLEAQRQLLNQALQQVVTEQERLAQQKAEFAEQQKPKPAPTGPDEGFEKELEYVSGLNPRQAKEHVLRVWRKHPADAVRLFAALDVGRGKRILEQFKTPEELQIVSDLLERVRLQRPSEAGVSGTTGGSAAP